MFTNAHLATLTKQLFSVLLLVVVTGFCQAQSTIYRHVDSNGKVTYSDSPLSNEDTEVELPPLNTSETDDGDQGYSDPSPEPREAISYQLDIQTPANDSTIPPGASAIIVAASLTPPARQPLTFELVFNGEALLQATSPNFTIEEPFRGSHSIRIQAFDDNGDWVAESDTITVHVIRPTVRN